MGKIVKICGIPYRIEEVSDPFDGETVGQIVYAKQVIRINTEQGTDYKKATLCHEIVHGILNNLGYKELSEDEQFVQAFGCAAAQAFDIHFLPEKED